MKWALLVVAFVSLFVCCELGQPISFRLGTVNSDAGLIALAIAAPAYMGLLMAGLVGLASVVGAALVQISENKRRD